MKAIETEYKGYRFRSRLEARWAVFFDTLGLEWEYEKEGFEFADGVRYLPDFWLPSIETWVEVKGTEPTDDEMEKARLLAAHTGHRVWVTFGEIPFPHPDSLTDPTVKFPYESGYMVWGDGADHPYWFCTCPECGAIGIEFDGRGARVCREHGYDGKAYSAGDRRLVAAYAAARSARFEHGETPEVP